MAFDINSAKPLIQEKQKESLGEKLYGTAQAVTQGATAGQGSHLAGAGYALGGALYNLTHKQNPLKDLKKDYVEGRETFKKENKRFAEEHPAINIGSEILGGIVGAGKIGKGLQALNKGKTALNSARLLNNPIAKAALVGAGYGGAYGASNTLGKGFDINSALLGSGIGAATGGALAKILPIATQKLLNGKKVEQLGEGTKKVLLENSKAAEGALPTEVIDVTPSKVINNLPQPLKRENVLSKLTNTAKNKAVTGYETDVVDYLVPNGMENKNFRAFLEDPKIQYEAAKGSIGRRWESLQNEAANEFRKMNKEIRNVAENAYNLVPDDTIITFGKENPIALAQSKIDELTNKKITVNQAAPLKKAQDLLFMIQSTLEKQPDGKLGLSFGNIKDTTQQFNALAEMYRKKDNKHAAKMFNDIYHIFADLRDTNPQAKKASELYKDFMSINKGLREIGFDVEKTTQNNNIETRIQREGRGRAGYKLNLALDRVARILEKYPELEQFKDLKHKVRLAQVSYDARPTDNSKLLNTIAKTILHPIKTVENLGNTSAQDDLQALSMRIFTGKVNPKQFAKVPILKGGDLVNRSFYRNKAYGSVPQTLKDKTLTKDTIEKAYAEFLAKEK